MKRSDIPSTIFGAAFFLTLALMAVIVAPIVVLVYAYDGWQEHRRQGKS